MNLIVYAVVTILILIIVYLEYRAIKKWENKKTFGVHLAVVVIAFILGLLVSNFIVVPLSESLKEATTPQPKIEVYVNSVDTIFQSSEGVTKFFDDLVESIDSGVYFKMSYIAFCEESKTGMLYLYKLKSSKNGVSTIDFATINEEFGECDNCQEHLITMKNKGKGIAENIEVQGDFPANSPVILTISDYTKGKTYWSPNNLENSFVSVTNNLEPNNESRDVTRITTKKKISPNIISCSINKKRKNCEIIIAETEILQFDTDSIKGFELEYVNKPIVLPTPPKEGYKSYLFDASTMRFVPANAIDIMFSEKYPCK